MMLVQHHRGDRVMRCVDLDEVIERTAYRNGWQEGSQLDKGVTKGQEGGKKRQPARCSRKTQNKFAIASMAKKLLHRCIGAHA